MTKPEFIEKFEENVVFVPRGSVTVETLLNGLEEWDSMAVVAVIALIDEYTGTRVNVEQLSQCTTVGDILDLVKGKLEG